MRLETMDNSYGPFTVLSRDPRTAWSMNRSARVSALVLVRCGPSCFFLIFSAVRTNVPLLWSPESEPFPDICHILSAEEIQK